jgi:hypothetical protein
LIWYCFLFFHLSQKKLALKHFQFFFFFYITLTIFLLLFKLKKNSLQYKIFPLFQINYFNFILHLSLFTFTQQKNSHHKRRGGERRGEERVIKRDLNIYIIVPLVFEVGLNYESFPKPVFHPQSK